jgi:hypothetical protein
MRYASVAMTVSSEAQAICMCRPLRRETWVHSQ